jgi:hypothetical protein
MPRVALERPRLLRATLLLMGTSIFACVDGHPLLNRSVPPRGNEWLPGLEFKSGTHPLPRGRGTDLLLGRALIKTQQTGNSETRKQNARPEGSTTENAPTSPPAEVALYSYEFTQPQFYIRHIIVEHDQSGRGKITFERLNEDSPIVEQLTVSPAVLAHITGLWQSLRFLDSDTNYQSDRQFAHLGTMRIKMEQGTRRRTAEFNWTNNRDASALVNEYRKIADQAILVFDVSVARENQPLNAPKLMELLESMLKRSALSEPQQLLPLLKEISTDEHLPLIARNHATRLLKRIEGGK